MFGNTVCHIRASRSVQGRVSAARAVASSSSSRRLTRSGSGKWLAARRWGMRSAATAYGAGRRPPPPLARASARLILGPSDPLGDRPSTCASSTWRRPSGRSRDASPAPSGALDDAVSPACPGLDPGDRLSRRGAPVEYPAHSASFHPTLIDAPPKPGIKHLASCLEQRESPFRSRPNPTRVPGLPTSEFQQPTEAGEHSPGRPTRKARPFGRAFREC